jgi:hypothetical protein
MSLKEIRKRHEKDRIADFRMQRWTKGIHDDRAELLELLDEAVEVIKRLKLSSESDDDVKTADIFLENL